MKKAVIILSILVFIVKGEDSLHSQTVSKNYTVEDTVRYQIGGKLYRKRDGLNIRPSDSITVIESFGQQYGELPPYRGYIFIVHNRNSYAHRFFSTSYLDSVLHVCLQMYNFLLLLFPSTG